MRLERLFLKAFGPFSERMLDFSPQPDLHLIYGPNEAGKSTTLRALRAALFGVPERTGDDHRFPYSQLRVGAVVCNGDRQRVAFLRRKARRNALTVMDAQTGVESGEAFPEATLAALLQGLTEGMFDSLFGFDHDGLVQGGEALLQGQGELGQSLFEAGAGLAQVRKLRAALEEDADRLFRPRASTSLLYKAIGAYDDARRQERDLVLKSSEWQALKAAADAAEQRHVAAIREQERVQQHFRRLERLAAVLPQVASRAHKLALLQPLHAVPRLDADAASRRVAAQTKAAEARKGAAEAARRQAEVAAELAGIRVPEAVLREEIAIEAAYHSIKAFRTARDSAVSAKGRLAEAESAVGRLLRSLAPEVAAADVQTVLPGPTLIARVTALAASGARLTERIEGAQQAVAEREAEQQRLRDQLAQFGAEIEVQPLSSFLEAAAGAGDPESRAAVLAREVEAGARLLEREAAELQAESPDALVKRTVPLPAELARFEAERDAIAEAQRAAATSIQAVERDIAKVKVELAGLGSDTGITTALLTTVRAERDALWQRIRLHFLPVAGDPPAAGPVPAAPDFEASLQRTDQIADSLFADAERATRQASLAAREREMARALAQDRAGLAVLAERQSSFEQEWQSLRMAHGLPELTIAAMKDWLARRREFLVRYDANQVKGAELVHLLDEARDLRSRLDAALETAGLPVVAAGERLAQGLARARAAANRLTKDKASRVMLAGQLATTAREIARLKTEATRLAEQRAAWDTTWADAMAAIRLGPTALPQEAEARLRELAELHNALEARNAAAADLQRAEIERDRIDSEVSRLCAAIDHSRGGRAADLVADSLYQALGNVRQLAARCSQLEQVAGQLVRARADAESALAEAEVALRHLTAAAGVEDEQTLLVVEEQDAHRRCLESEVAQLEESLVHSAAMSLDAILAEAGASDIDSVRAELDRSAEVQHQCADGVTEAHEQWVVARTALERASGGSDAARAQQQVADEAARIGTLAGDYAAARLASAMLERVIDDYQQRNQGPIVTRASEFYRRITGNAFAGIAVEFENDIQVLVAVRPDGTRLNVGALSTGRRDQLFLALRLAATERAVAANGPMPLVIDDLLIQFDDAAAAASFEVLGELSQKTQILFFTHHQHLVDVAQKALAAERVVTHAL